jgi:hypothetical protein
MAANVRQQVKGIEAVRGEVVSNGDGPQSKTLTWHGAQLTLPAALPATFMFDAFAAQASADDQLVLVKALFDLVGPEQWAKARAVAAEQQLPSEAFNELVSDVLEVYGMQGEASAPGGSSATGGR